MMTRKRPAPRPPKAKPGQIKFALGFDPELDEEPDWYVDWSLPARKGGATFILSELSKLSKELVRRGYDPKSIKFECKKLEK